MTLRELCSYFRQYSDDEGKCEHYKNQYFVANHGNFHFEELNEQDIIGLRPYLQCYILGIYEYLLDKYGVDYPDWISRYSSAYCIREENDYYKELERGHLLLHGSNEGLVECFDSILSKSLDVFRKRGIAREVFDDTV